MRQLVITQSITNRESKSLEKYLQEIGKSHPVTAEEEVVLAGRIRQGDQDALQALTLANLRFVVSVAKQYQAQGLYLSDLINEGNIGLMKAAVRFDETRGFKFISFAVWWIRQSIMQAIMEKGRIVHLPINKKTLYIKILKAQSLLEQDLEREPTAEEIAAYLEIQSEEVAITIRSNAYHVSLDTPLSIGEDVLLIDTLPANGPASDHGFAHHRSLQIDLMQCIKILNAAEKKIIMQLYGVGSEVYSADEISKQMNISTERVRQIRQRALKKLKDSTRSLVLKSYLGD